MLNGCVQVAVGVQFVHVVVCPQALWTSGFLYAGIGLV